jgi:hypothetical protein
LVQRDEGPDQIVRLGHRGTPSVNAATKLPFPRRPPHSIFRFRASSDYAGVGVLRSTWGV